MKSYLPRPELDMALSVTDFNSLESATLREIEDFLVQFIQTAEPTLDLSPSSVLFQLLIRPAAIFHGVNQENMDRVRNANSIKLVTENPDEADTDTLDNLLSNYFITRREGEPATGQIRLILSESRFTPISDSMQFTANGIIFRPVRSVNGVSTENEILTGNEILIEAISNDQYSFLIDVVAEEDGKAGNVARNTLFSYSTTLSHVTGAVAAGDFDNGDDEETNEELVTRLNNGISSKNLGSREAIAGMYSVDFPTIRDLSVIGAGDTEMRRDQHNVLGVSSHGKADIYVRTRTQLVTWLGTKTGTLQAVSATSVGTWVMNFTRDEVPAAYTVLSIQDPEELAVDGSLEITSIERGVDVSEIDGVDFTPTMQDNEHIFTRYQTMQVVFKTENETGTVGDTYDFDVEVLYQPEIAEISDYTINRVRRHPAGDYLVKASVPCIVAVGLTLTLGPGDQEPDLDAIKQSVADAVNSTDFLDGRVSVDKIIEAVSPHLTGRTRVKLPVDLRGRVITPSAEVDPTDINLDGDMWIFSTQEIAIPTVAEFMLSSRTVSFFLSANDVDITVLPSDHLMV